MCEAQQKPSHGCLVRKNWLRRTESFSVGHQLVLNGRHMCDFHALAQCPQLPVTKELKFHGWPWDLWHSQLLSHHLLATFTFSPGATRSTLCTWRLTVSVCNWIIWIFSLWQFSCPCLPVYGIETGSLFTFPSGSNFWCKSVMDSTANNLNSSFRLCSWWEYTSQDRDQGIKTQNRSQASGFQHEALPDGLLISPMNTDKSESFH